MKNFWLAGLLALVAAGLEAQQESEALGQLRVRVTDESGLPVVRAQVALSTFHAWVPGQAGVGRGENATVLGVTDTNGTATLTLASETGRMGCMVLPVPGFQWHLGTDYTFTNAVAGRWEPWSPLVPVTLKRIDPAYVPEMETNGEPPGKETLTPKDPGIALPALFPEKH